MVFLCSQIRLGVVRNKQTIKETYLIKYQEPVYIVSAVSLFTSILLLLWILWRFHRMASATCDIYYVRRIEKKRNVNRVWMKRWDKNKLKQKEKFVKNRRLSKRCSKIITCHDEIVNPCTKRYCIFIQLAPNRGFSTLRASWSYATKGAFFQLLTMFHVIPVSTKFKLITQQ